MKWLILSCFLMWARHGEGGALKCLPEDSACSTQLLKEVEQQEMETRRPSGLSDAPAECLSGSEWESNCHSCRCMEGEAQCVRQPGCESIEEPIRCKPNTTFERECNECRCLPSGLGLCTAMECPGVPTEAPPSKPIIPKGVDCAPGTTWQSQCNDCVCSPEGHRHCTEKACPGQETEPLLRCAPQSQWKNDCNMCWCNSGRAMCTKMGCMAIPSDMHFDDRKGELEKEEVAEPNDPDLNNNLILESAARDQKHMSENLEDLDTTTDPVEENLSEIELKNLEDFDNNDIDTPIQIPEQVMTDFAANTDSSVLDDDLELLKTLLSQSTQDENKKELESSYNLKGVNRDIEVLEESYFNLNRQTDGIHRVKKRSACKPNEEFQNDCNTCKCSESGQIYGCTQNECMGGDNGGVNKDVDKEVEVFMENEGVDHIQRHSVCKASTTFYVGCNPCHCNSDGTDFSCTNKPCPLPEDVEVFHELHALKTAKNATKKVCVENRMFIMNCNTCWCNEDGTSYFCTRKVCVPGEEQPVIEQNNEAFKTTKNATKKVCVENRMFIMNCNTCWCNEDGTSYICTRKVCVPGENEPVIEEGINEKLRIIKQECRPGEVFEIDCNMCRCNPDGKSYSCTRRACFDDETKNKTLTRKTRATSQETPKAKNCQPRQEFRMDCNTCLCDDYGVNFSCTRIDCVALNNNNNNNNNNGNRRKRDVSQKVPSDCVPDSVFEQDCNVCRCTKDGGHATCTLKRCQSKENSTASATESSFRCNPGEQFKQSCNDCSCSADGKSVFCTLLVCDDELSP